jgi:hypothetical protein
MSSPLILAVGGNYSHPPEGINMVLMALLLIAVPAQDAAALEIINKAIAAHGGLEALSKTRADKVKLKGTIQMQGKPLPFIAETSVMLPDRLRNQVRINPGAQEVVLTQLLHGEKMGMFINNMPQKLTENLANELRETLIMNQVMRLVPLIKDPELKPTFAGAGVVNGRSSRIVRVAPLGRREIKLWFDQETGLLVKTEHPVGTGDKPVWQEEYYGNFREMGVFRRPAKMTTVRAGQKIMEAELVEVRYLDSIPENEFLAP